MSEPEEPVKGLNEAILEWMKENGVARGGDCPVLKVTVVGYAEDGVTPMVTLRPAYDKEIAAAESKGK